MDMCGKNHMCGVFMEGWRSMHVCVRKAACRCGCGGLYVYGYMCVFVGCVRNNSMQAGVW